VSPENSAQDDAAKERPPSGKKKLPPKKKEKKHKSVLQTKLSKLAIQIGYIGIASAALTFTLLILRLVIEEFGVKKNSWSNKYVKYILSYLINAITVIVVGVPEGLPLAVTLALAFAVKVN
jgi:Ca2+ transporting ATPase